MLGQQILQLCDALVYPVTSLLLDESVGQFVGFLQGADKKRLREFRLTREPITIRGGYTDREESRSYVIAEIGSTIYGTRGRSAGSLALPSHFPRLKQMFKKKKKEANKHRKNVTNLAFFSSLHPPPGFINVHGEIHPKERRTESRKGLDNGLVTCTARGKREIEWRLRKRLHILVKGMFSKCNLPLHV